MKQGGGAGALWETRTMRGGADGWKRVGSISKALISLVNLLSYLFI